MVDAEAGTKDAAQTVHHLNSQRYLWQQVEHLAFLLQFTLNKMDVNLRLATGGDTVEQRHLFLHHREKNLVVGFLLGNVELFDKFRVRLSSVVQTSHLQLIGLKQPTLHKGIDGGKGMATIEQFVA